MSHPCPAQVEGTAIQKFRVQCAGEGHDFAGKPAFERFITWKEGRTLALEVEKHLENQIKEDANVWRRSGPATKGKTFQVPDEALQAFTKAAADLDADEDLTPEEKERKTRKIEKKRRNTITALAAGAQKEEEARRFAKLAKGILMAAAFDSLKPGFDYRCRATAISSVGEGPFSPPTFNSRTPPDLPAGPRAGNG